LSFTAILGWSPLTRKLLEVKRRDGNLYDGVERVEIEGLLRSPTRIWAAGIFSAAERDQADEAPLDARYFAGRFAAKEAISKALGIGFSSEVTVHGIEILRLPSGAPTINVTGGAQAVADALRVTQWFISITYSFGMAMASVIAAAN
jgi:holo-[acyl-carrier protein] synthase